MKGVTISNIAWTQEEEPGAARLLADLGVEAVEVAPTKRWPDLSAVPAEEAAGFRTFWDDHGIEIVAMQALLYGHPDLTLFVDPEARARTEAYLGAVLVLAGRLGARRLVFGSPRNRQAQDRDDAWPIAVSLFRRLGEKALSEGVVLCIEPNPPAYQCDFVTTSDEGWRLVEEVGSPGFGLHLDAAGMTLAGEDPVAALHRHALHLRHLHLSAPQLGPVNREVGIDYAGILGALEGYDGWASLEMRPHPGDNLPRVADSLGYCLSLR